MTAITFGPAEARHKKVVAGIAGGTGSGKTYSALEIGTGLVTDPARHLFVIDTESGRAAHYANQFAFQYGQLGPPFTVERYIEAIDASIAAGSRCTIVDSGSHMWEGAGGAREQAAAIAQRMAERTGGYPERYSYTAWNEPKEAITKFVLYLQKCEAHLILCLRAKEKSRMVKDRHGKTEIVNIGLQPIMEEGVPYECTFLAMLDQEQPGVPHWTHKALASYLQPLFDNGQKQLSREHGRRLAQWCGAESHRPSREHADEQSLERQVDEDQDRVIKRLRETAPPASGDGVKTAKQRAQEIAAAFSDAPTLQALLSTEERVRSDMNRLPDSAKATLAKLFHERREQLTHEADEPASFADEMTQLELDEPKE